MKLFKMLSLILILALSTACTHHKGNMSAQDENTVSKIKVGHSKSKVKSIMGAPNMTRKTNGAEEWSYIHNATIFSGKMLIPVYGSLTHQPKSSQEMVVVKFNKKGLVRDVEVIKNNI